MIAVVQANDPGANALFWDDMVNPYHNGGQCDYQTVVGGGRPGCTDGALLQGMIHENVTFYSWAYGHTNTSDQWSESQYTDWRKISHAPELFGKADSKNASHPSYQWVASPLGDPINIVWWAEAVQVILTSSSPHPHLTLTTQAAQKAGGRPLG